MEYWDICNQKGEDLGYTKRRGETLANDEFHKVVHVWIGQTDGRFLVQKRSLTKETVPGLYAAHAGSVLAGEQVVPGAIREVFEEIGILLLEDELNLVKVMGPSVRKKVVLTIFSMSEETFL